GFGAERKNRMELPVEVLKTIKYEQTLQQLTDFAEPVINWTLTVAVPVNVFYFHNFKSIQNKQSRMNFHKCGDDLPHPHYLVWKNVEWFEPNFHLPEFFGKVEFL
ncbi:MAG TPA: carbohydrate-binding family 9-like protein, partial [Mucilaginibacter sp.]|nr:carbohydrate-binding family 9-like protein [Mucilaginibacter sp.]